LSQNWHVVEVADTVSSVVGWDNDAPEMALQPSLICIHCLPPCRHYRAIISGCIPVTFFHAYDIPYAKHLRLDWAAFSVNIEPDDIERVNDILGAILEDKPRLLQLQEELERVAPMFVYGEVIRD
jgi:hypothetical protein